MKISAQNLPIAALAAAILAALLYLNTLSGPFLNDDIAEIENNPQVHSMRRIPSLFVSGFWKGGRGQSPLYRPLTGTVSTILYVTGGGRPLVFHTFNLLLHSAVSALTVLTVFALGFELPVALITGLFFAAHPVHTEAVGWISGQAELLATFFLLVAWNAHRRDKWSMATVAFALAMLSKEMAVVFPAMLMVVDWLASAQASRPGHQAPRPPKKAYALYCATAAGYLALRYAVLGHFFGGGAQVFGAELLNPLVGEPASTRMLTSARVLGVALRQAWLPRELCFNYGYNQIRLSTGIADAGLLLAGAILAVGAGLWLPKKYRTAMGIGAVIFLLAFLPASNLFFSSISIFAERNLYLPVLGVCLIGASLLASPRWRWSLAFLAVAGMGARTMIRNEEFLSSLRLYKAASVACPASAGAWSWYGIALKDAGQLDAAVDAQRHALEIAPQFADARAELGLTYSMQGKLEAAETELTHALQLRSNDWRARANLGLLYANTGRLAAALHEYELAIEAQPDNLELKSNYASALADAARVDEARALFERIDRDEPDSAVGPNGLGALAARDQKWEQAAIFFAQAVRRDPRNANAIFNLAQALERTGRHAEAIARLEAAVTSGIADQGITELLLSLRGGQGVPR